MVLSTGTAWHGMARPDQERPESGSQALENKALQKALY